MIMIMIVINLIDQIFNDYVNRLRNRLDRKFIQVYLIGQINGRLSNLFVQARIHA